MRCSLAILAVLLAACGTTGSSRPGQAIDAYAAALDKGDYGRAYELMSSRYKKEHSREEFVRMLKESGGEVRETAARLRAGRRKVEVSARLRYGELDDDLLLVEESGAWRIAGDPLDFYPQDTPAAALRSFLRAVKRGRFDVVLRFVPAEYRATMTEAQLREQFEGEHKADHAAMLQLLEANVDNPIEQQGDAARMPFGERYEVKFKREDGVWKIEDPF